MKVMARGYRFTISYILMALAIILAFIRMEIIAENAVDEACKASTVAQQSVVSLVNALVATSDDPSDPALLARRDRVLDRIELRQCNG